MDSIKEAGVHPGEAPETEEDPTIEEVPGEISTKDHLHTSSPMPPSSINPKTTLFSSAPI